MPTDFPPLAEGRDRVVLEVVADRDDLAGIGPSPLAADLDASGFAAAALAALTSVGFDPADVYLRISLTDTDESDAVPITDAIPS